MRPAIVFSVCLLAAAGCATPGNTLPNEFVECSRAIDWVHHAQRRVAVAGSEETLYLPVLARWSNQVTGFAADDECISIQEAVQGIDLPLLTAGGSYRTTQLHLADGSPGACSGTLRPSAALDLGPDQAVAVTEEWDMFWSLEGDQTKLLLTAAPPPPPPPTTSSAPANMTSDFQTTWTDAPPVSPEDQRIIDRMEARDDFEPATPPAQPNQPGESDFPHAVRPPPGPSVCLFRVRGQLIPTRVLYLPHAGKLLLAVQVVWPGALGAEDYVLCFDLKRLEPPQLSSAAR